MQLGSNDVYQLNIDIFFYLLHLNIFIYCVFFFHMRTFNIFNLGVQ